MSATTTPESKPRPTRRGRRSELSQAELKSIARNGLKDRLKRHWQLYVLLALPAIYTLIFLYWPMYGLVIGFKNYSPALGINGSPWVGPRYLIQFLTSYQFWPVLSNTLLLSFYSLAALIPLPIVLAVLLNAVRSSKFRRTVQLITFAPYFISTVVIVGIMLLLFAGDTGLISRMVEAVTGQQINYFGPGAFRHMFVWSSVWQTLGYAAIIYLAALAGIDPELHEAAKVDGAGIIRRIWHIDLPGILPVMITLLILNMGEVLTVGFEKVLLLQNPLNLGVSEVIDTYAFRVAFGSQVAQFSYGTVIGLFKSVIALTLLLTVNWLAKRVTKQGLF